MAPRRVPVLLCVGSFMAPRRVPVLLCATSTGLPLRRVGRVPVWGECLSTGLQLVYGASKSACPIVALLLFTRIRCSHRSPRPLSHRAASIRYARHLSVRYYFCEYFGHSHRTVPARMQPGRKRWWHGKWFAAGNRDGLMKLAGIAVNRAGLHCVD